MRPAKSAIGSFSRLACPRPSEGKDQRFESPRARQSNQRAIEVVRKRAKAKLTINSPMKRVHGRVIGGGSVAPERCANCDNAHSTRNL